MRFSLKCAASVGVNEHVGRADEFCGTTVAFDALLLEVWFGPGDGLLWLPENKIGCGLCLKVVSRDPGGNSLSVSSTDLKDNQIPKKNLLF